MSVAVACTAFLDRNTVQCHNDADCVHFGGHPSCDLTELVCKPSGLAPSDCFLGTPAANTDFYNRCSKSFLPSKASAAACLSFDNCGRLGLGCGSPEDAGIDANDPLVPPPPQDAAAAEGGIAPPLLPPYCKDLIPSGSSAVYLSGSSNFVGLLAQLAPILAQQPYNLAPVLRVTDSCTGASSMYPGNEQTSHIIRDPQPGGTYAQYYDGSGGMHDCLLGANGVQVDVGESEIFPATCGLEEDPDHVLHTQGPVLPILFVVPQASLEVAISASAAREVLGSGGAGLPDGGVPWNSLFIRGSGTATARLIGLAIGVPVPMNRLWGSDQGSARALGANLALVQTAGPAEAALGLLGSDTYDQHRLDLKALAFQADGQECAYLPDSSSFTKDKINVRDGHYPIWGTLHFFIALSSKMPVSQQAFAFVSPFSGPKPPIEILDAFIGAHWVPQCAMKVERLTEMGDFVTDHPPPFQCNCYFDSHVLGPGKMAPGCKMCMDDDACDVGFFCNYGPNSGGHDGTMGFCESLY